MTRRYLVSGRVQGVGFRWFASRAARDLGVAGFVRNLPDGRVEVVAAGDEADLAALQARLASGPPGALVERIDVSEVPDEVPAPNDFSIR